jgi:hypothetical protein
MEGFQSLGWVHMDHHWLVGKGKKLGGSWGVMARHAPLLRARARAREEVGVI